MKTANVVIVGGGIVGSAIASSLSREMDGVLLLEKEGIAAQASGSNYGMAWIQPRTPGFEYRIASRSLEIYDDLVENHFDLDIEYEKAGGLTVGFTPAQKKAIDWYCKRKHEMGIPVRMIDGKEVADLEPNLNPGITSAVYCEKDTQLNPYLTTMAFADLAKKRGTEILSGTAVHKINLKSGRVASVDTSAGNIETQAIIIANSYLSRQLAQTVNLDIPIFPQRLQSLVTEAVEKLLTRIIQGARELSDEDAENHPEYALEYDYAITGTTEEDLPKMDVERTIFAFLKPTISGTIVLGTTNEFEGMDRRTTPRGLSGIIKETLKICPALANMHIIRTWAGLIPYTFDSKPILGKIPEIPGLYIAAGHPHAFSHAPTVGEVFAELFTKGNHMSEFAQFVLTEASINRFRGSEKKV